MSTSLRVSREQAIELVKRSIESQGHKVKHIFAHVSGYTIDIEPGGESNETSKHSN